jgi:hypothetical protein
MKRFSWNIPIVALLLVAMAPIAGAQENPRADVAPIYEEGLRAMGAKDYVTACRKFTEVTQKYPEGIGAWLELGRCEEARGRLARAYDVFKAGEAAATSVGQTERAKRATDAARALESRLSKWTIVVPMHLRSLPGLVVQIDGDAIGPEKWDKPIPVDGGTHVVTAKADGKKPWQSKVELKNESDWKSVQVGPFEDVTVAIAPVIAPVLPPKRTSPLRVGGFVTGGVGVAALVAGSIAGGVAISRHGDAVDGGHCANGGCNEIGGKLEAASRAAGNVSTGMFVAGGVLVAAGAVMAFAIPTKEKGSAMVLVGPTGAAVRLVF